MILESVFNKDENSHEHVPMVSPGMPYICIRSEIDSFPERKISWHWHTSIELLYVESGALQMKTPDATKVLTKGMAVFINSGVLHEYVSIGKESCWVFSHLFHMQFLSGAYNSVFEEKYFTPVCHSGGLPFWIISPDTLPQLELITCLLKAKALMAGEPEGYEFEIRSLLSTAWLILFRETKELRGKLPLRSTADTERIKQMMDYISANYADPISVQDIASAAGISVRECSRCFRRSLGFPPAAYLTDYRIRMAARALNETGRTITEISESCGFSSPGYFSRVFKEVIGSSPKEYQKKQLMAEK